MREHIFRQCHVLSFSLAFYTALRNQSARQKILNITFGFFFLNRAFFIQLFQMPFKVIKIER